ncbi:MAG TPA: methyltransferase domain-containing protein [Burkholderiales bacterium]|nr:methyltransferase domain-containing protein [Burkholderiales bacterium]
MINKQLMMNNFNKAADDYLCYAQIQKDPALKIYSLIENKLNSDLNILDLGSGPGTFSHFSNFLANSNFILYDISLSMLKSTFNKNKFFCINGDAELLPFKNNSFNLVISNLMMQWLNNKKKVFKEINKVIHLGSEFIFTSLISPSLWQLKNSWAEIDNNSHVINFITGNEYAQLCQDAGFKIIQQQEWSSTLFFKNCYELFYHFKRTGTNIPRTNKSGLGGVNILNKLIKSYEKFRTTEGLPLTYSYVLIYGKKL